MEQDTVLLYQIVVAGLNNQVYKAACTYVRASRVYLQLQAFPKETLSLSAAFVIVWTSVELGSVVYTFSAGES